MDNLTPSQRQKNMRNIRSIGTIPEKMVQRELKARKIYFSKNVKSIVGKPDIVFRRKKVAVFIDSDFWHGHPKRFTRPKTNRAYWDRKIAGNKERDKKVNRELRKQGWRVIRIWEYDIKNRLNFCLKRIEKAISV